MYLFLLLLLRCMVAYCILFSSPCFFNLKIYPGDCSIVWWIWTHFCHIFYVIFIQVFYFKSFLIVWSMLFALPAYFLVFQKVCVLGFSQGSWLGDVGRDLLWKSDHIQFWEDSWGEDLEGGIGGSEKESLVRSSKLVTMGRQVGAFREIWEANYVQPLKCDCEGEAWREPHGKPLLCLVTPSVGFHLSIWWWACATAHPAQTSSLYFCSVGYFYIDVFV